MAQWWRNHDGEPRLASWMMTALASGQDGEPVGVGICPVCYTIVVADPDCVWGDQRPFHEAWHARTDFPIPEEL